MRRARQLGGLRGGVAVCAGRCRRAASAAQRAVVAVERREEEPLEGSREVGAALVVQRQQLRALVVTLLQQPPQQARQHELALRHGLQAVRLRRGRRRLHTARHLSKRAPKRNQLNIKAIARRCGRPRAWHERACRTKSAGGARCRRCVTPTMAASASDTPIGNTSRSNCSSGSSAESSAASPAPGARSSAVAASSCSDDGKTSCMPAPLYTQRGISTLRRSPCGVRGERGDAQAAAAPSAVRSRRGVKGLPPAGVAAGAHALSHTHSAPCAPVAHERLWPCVSGEHAGQGHARRARASEAFTHL